MTLADEVALLALAIDRAHGDDEAMLLVRLEFDALWERYRRATQPAYDRYVREAREEMAAQIAADIVESNERATLALVKQ